MLAEAFTGVEVRTARTGFVRALGSERPGLAAFAGEAARVLADPKAPHTMRRDASRALDEALDRIEDADAWQGRYLGQLRRQAAVEKVKIERNSTQGLFLEVPANTPVPAGAAGSRR